MNSYKKDKNEEAIKELKAIFKKYKIYPKKRYSQSFLINPILIEWHLKFADLNSDDFVLEIGAGIGILTLSLVQKVKKVIAIEIDKTLIKVLKNRLASYKNVELIQSDILEIDKSLFKDKKVISNPPYNISSPLLFKLFKTKYKMAILTLQKEFAERLIAKPNSKAYGRISVNSYLYADIELLKIVPNTFFYPTPKVDSALVKILPKSNNTQILNVKFYNELVITLFSQKNKVLEKVLKGFLKKRINESKIQKIISNISCSRNRIRELTPEQIVELSNRLYQKLSRT
ncbi:MAG: ribosomal RNA small subunit methyltransferase A [Candidatus Helarchaeota archaeon]|nr:ribosomal RNA small subunit methyltransferase A [Candidatus Helarchaeota archaeon]